MELRRKPSPDREKPGEGTRLGQAVELIGAAGKSV